MATIMVHRPTGLRYVLVGSGFAAWSSATPNPFLAIVEVDGKSPAQHLTSEGPYR